MVHTFGNDKYVLRAYNISVEITDFECQYFRIVIYTLLYRRILGLNRSNITIRKVLFKVSNRGKHLQMEIYLCNVLLLVVSRANYL